MVSDCLFFFKKKLKVWQPWPTENRAALSKTQLHLSRSPTKAAQLKSNHKETSDKPELRDILLCGWSLLLENVKVKMTRAKELSKVNKTAKRSM